MSVSIKKIAIFGATSDIATAVARAAISPGVEFFLAARNEQDLSRCAQDLKTRGAARVETRIFNATAFHEHSTLASEAWNLFGGFDLILIAHGALVDAKKAFEDFKTAQAGFEINALSVFSLTAAFLPHLKQAGAGTFAVISSVAADRGRKKLGVYCASKAAVDSYLSALRQELSNTAINVLTIKPGIVKTKMTQQEKHGLLSASPESVGRDILHAIKKGKLILYTPRFWEGIMMIIRNIPEGIFRKLSF